MINRFNPNVCETFYSTNVVIVEGDTEAVIFRELLKRNHSESDYFVLNSGSKNNIPFFQRILNHFHIPYVVVHDSDTRFRYEDKARTIVAKKNNGDPAKNSAWAINENIWSEIQEGVTLGNFAKRVVSVYEFESQSGYVYDSGLGKPLSAYNFAVENSYKSDNYAVSALSNIVQGKYEKSWSQEEIEEIPEPING
ncbi:MAG: ATP-dependent endonuclease [Candidatus Electrothrix sp. AUS4]|nr:ATP-dependent endonuclease [Candidatus Electrothrix sp. AUS4]